MVIGNDSNAGYGTLPCISYGGLELTLRDCYQDSFLHARDGSKWTAAAIDIGKRGEALIPAFMRDFGCWMTCRADMRVLIASDSLQYSCIKNRWPSPTLTASSQYIRFKDTDTQALPISLDVLLEIVAHAPISAVLSLASTCRGLRNWLTSTEVMNSILRASVLLGSLRYVVVSQSQLECQSNQLFHRWLLPVVTFRNEMKRALPVFDQWLTSQYALTDQNPSSAEYTPSTPVTSPFLDHKFPFYAFVPACLTVDTSMPSMSMSNRRRFWNVAQQFQVLWMDYRTKGWERDDTLWEWTSYRRH